MLVVTRVVTDLCHEFSNRTGILIPGLAQGWFGSKLQTAMKGIDH